MTDFAWIDEIEKTLPALELRTFMTCDMRLAKLIETVKVMREALKFCYSKTQHLPIPMALETDNVIRRALSKCK